MQGFEFRLVRFSRGCSPRARACAAAAVAAAVGLLGGSPAMAATIAKGIDVWATPSSGAATRFGTGPLDTPPPSAELFCGSGSTAPGMAVPQSVTFSKGADIATYSSAAGGTPTGELASGIDTVIERDEVTIPNGGSGATPLRMIALSFTGSPNVTVDCGGGDVRTYQVTAALASDHFEATDTDGDGATAATLTGELTIAVDAAGTAGTYGAEFPVRPVFTFTQVTPAGPAAPVTYEGTTITLVTTGAPTWAAPSSSDVTVSDDLYVDIPGTTTRYHIEKGTTGNFRPRVANHVDARDPNNPEHQHDVEPPDDCSDCSRSPAVSLSGLLPLYLLFDRRRMRREATKGGASDSPTA